jgi:pyruvate/2-oxoglutarate dehydrogenase complex dihydrolipoamide dehydrogenase (E3) component
VSAQNSKGVEFLFKKNKITWIKGTGTLGANKSVKVTLRRRQDRDAHGHQGPSSSRPARA